MLINLFYFKLLICLIKRLLCGYFVIGILYFYDYYVSDKKNDKCFVEIYVLNILINLNFIYM